MANVVFRLLGNVVELAGVLAQTASANPFSAILIAAGAVLLVFSFGLFGYLTAGALLSGVIPENIGRTPPQQGG